MPRAKAVIEKQGLRAVDMPMDFYQKQNSLLWTFTPVVRVFCEPGGFGMKFWVISNKG